MVTTLERNRMAYYKSEHLLRMRWPDGSPGFCKACDAEAPMRATTTSRGVFLACPEEHLTHPVSLILARGYEED